MSRGKQRRSGGRARCRALRQQLIDQLAIGFLQASRRCFSVSNTRSARLTISSIQRSTSSGLIGSGAKSGMSSLAGEREMHFGDAPAGLRHVAQIGRPARRFRRDVRSPPASAARRRSGRDRPRSRSRRRPGFRRRHERSRSRCCLLSPSTSSTLPSSAGVLAKPATSVRKRPISISGLMPGSSLR